MDWTAAKLGCGHGGRQRLVLGRKLGHLLLEVTRRRALRDALDLNSTESGFLIETQSNTLRNTYNTLKYFVTMH